MCVRILHPTNSYGHMETGPQLKVSTDRVVKLGIESATPGLQGKWFIHLIPVATLLHLSHGMGFPTWYVQPAKPQISLRICAV